MIFLLALIPATGLTVAGYIALYLSHRSEGTLKTFGRYLGIWAFILAGLVALGGMFAAGHMHRMHGEMWAGHEGMHCPWMERHVWERPEHGEPGAEPGKPPVPPSDAPGPGAAPNPPAASSH